MTSNAFDAYLNTEPVDRQEALSMILKQTESFFLVKALIIFETSMKEQDILCSEISDK
ncbi:MAG: hypothetical protein JEY91_03995 [Spirochaetaceae bacterium]|nr:hypothetical protein [Spirochaetaceae bacterium]